MATQTCIGYGEFKGTCKRVVVVQQEELCLRCFQNMAEDTMRQIAIEELGVSTGMKARRIKKPIYGPIIKP